MTSCMARQTLQCNDAQAAATAHLRLLLLVLLLFSFFFHSAVSVVLQRATILLSYSTQPMCLCALHGTQAFQCFHE